MNRTAYRCEGPDCDQTTDQTPPMSAVHHDNTFHPAAGWFSVHDENLDPHHFHTYDCVIAWGKVSP